MTSSIRRRLKQGAGSALFIFASILLTSCDLSFVDLEQSITFYQNESWEADILVTLPADTISMFGSEEDARDQIETEMLDEYLPRFQEAGVDVKWEVMPNEIGDLIYSFQLKGKGLRSLKEAVFEESTEIKIIYVAGKRRLFFTHYAYLLDPLVENYTITLTGGKILSSNGTQIDRGTVQWTNPSGQIEATLTEKLSLDPSDLLLPVGCVLAFGFGSVLAISGGLWYARREQRNKSKEPEFGTPK